MAPKKSRWESIDTNHLKEQGYGFTSGSAVCAALCASLQQLWKLPQSSFVHISTPQDVDLHIEVFKHESDGASYSKDAWFYVLKDAGEDFDITDGAQFCGLACYKEDLSEAELMKLSPPLQLEGIAGLKLELYAYEGIGIVLEPGLKLALGLPAINPGPQEMIVRMVSACKDRLDETQKNALKNKTLALIASVPQGKELAKKTFNSRLGIVGGISILGTTGFVRPMSNEAWIEAIYLELDHRLAQSKDILLTFGSSGETQMMRHFNISEKHSVQMSNYVGKAYDYAVQKGAQNILIAGHPGKLIKLAAGIMNTHSHEADARKEILISHLALKGAPLSILQKISQFTTMQAAISLIAQSEYRGIWEELAEKISELLVLRAEKLYGLTPRIACVFISKDEGVLGYSKQTDDIVERLKEN
ncbi:MAG: cobalt-precorrin-5B (C(1))-methyltransferase CbiD [Coriobacteriia bacterium]|nr:cobalt-precorrin-5B (C(1))-methyltransferase CbiD [Coriobacteriia bacterium]